ncbi:uncharacterized protein BHQ10_004586 [Talaromyces amestolkiae]|uniref:Uncharacterized protein n=1 Tax=Talaromyces amestolkiae TaxID=1196081 RepID=A0A364KYG1_TALAM|nr:uncharacterized protein BHQ10_004586 [Talaromyces amestolkiae]RAO68574.1 hypothetical protein BHQ10_004586 [Talaromyces amestolkiae]
MDQQIVRRTNAPAQKAPLRQQRTYEELLLKIHECNTLTARNQQLEQENASFRLQLQLQRAPADQGSAGGRLESQLQDANTKMHNYITVMRAQLDASMKHIKEQQNTIEGMKLAIRRTRDFLNTEFNLDP